MEESNFNGNLAKQIPIRTTSKPKSNLSGRHASKNSHSLRRLNSTRVPRKESKGLYAKFQWIRANRVVFWLILISLWAYIGFYVQSKWQHNFHRKSEFAGYRRKIGSARVQEEIKKLESLKKNNSTIFSSKEHSPIDLKQDLDVNDMKLVSLSTGEREEREIVSSNPNPPNKKKKETERKMRKRTKSKGVIAKNATMEFEEGLIPGKNTTYGPILGPFGKTEDSILEWSADKRRGTCDRKGEFAKIVFSRSFVVIFHELSMTGAPLSMMELASELLSCGARVSAVVINRRGGLMEELEKRGIKVIKDRMQVSFKTAMKSDLVIAGSTVCSTWIEQYLLHYPTASSKIIWWIMENRREYFDRSKHLLNRVKTLVFLSQSQSEQWVSWCKEEKINLNSNSNPYLVPLSVNDELAFVAGIPCSLNTPEFSADKMLEKRNILREQVRREIGLSDNDFLIISLSSINFGKGQRLLLESSLLVLEKKVNLSEIEIKQEGLSVKTIPSNSSDRNLTYIERNYSYTGTVKDGEREQNLKVLIGSLGSKSNKVLYIKSILRFLNRNSNMSKAVMWAPATTRVASLYAAADAYVINAQGIGETFGRVTIEAMAFGLPVLGTDAGGTKEIVIDRETGLLHPVGREGIETLAKNILYLLRNPSIRVKMGERGRQLVFQKYLKSHTYIHFARVLMKSL